MKKFLLFLLLLFAAHVCFANTQDQTLQNCIKEQNYTTAGMLYCTDIRADEYENLSKGLIKSLKNIKTSNEYTKIQRNQRLYNKYFENLKNGEFKILYFSQGTIYPLIVAGIQLHINEINFQILDFLYRNISPEKEFKFDNITVEKIDTEIKQKLDKIQVNYSSKEYDKINQSQIAWASYIKDTEQNIFPMINNNSEIKEYILKLLYQNRLGIINTIDKYYDD